MAKGSGFRIYRECKVFALWGLQALGFLGLGLDLLLGLFQKLPRADLDFCMFWPRWVHVECQGTLLLVEDKCWGEVGVA